MTTVTEYCKSRLPDILFFLLGLLILTFIFGIKWFFEKDIPDCTQLDVYEISEWSQCQENNLQSREITQKNNLTCKNSGLVTVPDKQRVCEYIPPCNSQIEACSEKYVYLFKKNIKEYTTIINNEKYSADNQGNVTIKINGQFKKITLNIIADTSYKSAEYYYIFFGLDQNYINPKVLGTSRIQSNRLDTADYGIFQGTETPKKLLFDLNNFKLANSNGELGSTINDVVPLFNKNDDKILKMTLFVADGNSMTTNDLNKRIYGTISDAWLEYECVENSLCSIERVPKF